MTCLCRLARAPLETCDRARDAEQRLVEVADERAPVAVQEHRDEQPPQQLAASAPRSFAARSARSAGVAPRRAAPRIAAAQAPSPSPSAASSAWRSCSPRNGSDWKSASSQRSSASPRCASSSATPRRTRTSLGDRGAERIEPRRLARRRGRRDRQHGPDPVRAPVEPLEQDRPGRDRRRSGEPDRRDRVRELAGRVRRLVRAARQRAARARARRSGRARGRSSAGAAPPPRATSPPARRVAATRTRIPSPSSICVPTERPTSGATAPYEWPSP